MPENVSKGNILKTGMLLLVNNFGILFRHAGILLIRRNLNKTN